MVGTKFQNAYKSATLSCENERKYLQSADTLLLKSPASEYYEFMIRWKKCY